MAWLKCSTGPGAFEDELMVGVQTHEGRKRAFISKVHIKDFPGGTQLVEVETLGSLNEMRRVRLPGHTLDGSSCFCVFEDELITQF